jgi:hypothetical protein
MPAYFCTKCKTQIVPCRDIDHNMVCLDCSPTGEPVWTPTADEAPTSEAPPTKVEGTAKLTRAERKELRKLAQLPPEVPPAHGEEPGEPDGGGEPAA